MSSPSCTGRRSILAGFLVLAASLVVLPPNAVVAFHFDAPKRVVVMLLLLVLGWGGQWSRSGGGIGRWPRELRTWLDILILWVLVRWLFSGSVWRETGVMAAWLTTLLAFRVGLELSPDRLRRLSPWLVVAGIFQAVLMWLQRFDHWIALTWNIEVPSARMIGTIGYHNQAADFLALAVAVIPLCVWWAQDRSRHVRAFTTASAVLAGALMLATLPATGARGPSLGALLGLGVMAAGWASAQRLKGIDLPQQETETAGPQITGRNMSRIASSESTSTAVDGKPCLPPVVRRCIGTAVLVLAASGFALTLAPRLSTLRDLMGPESGFASRYWMFRVALRMWSERPFSGWGPGAFAYQYLDRLGALLPDVRTHRILQQITFARETHHEGLQILAEFGIVGFGLSLMLLVLTVGCLWRGRKHLSAWTGGFLLGYLLVQGQLSFLLQTALPGPLMALWLGGCLSVCRQPPIDPKFPSPNEMTLGAGKRVLQRLRCGLPLGLLVACAVFHSASLWGLLRVSAILDRTNLEAACNPGLPPWAHAHQARLGSLLLREELTPDGIRMFESALAGYVDPHLLNNLGAGYASRGEWENALTIYQRWLRSGIHAEDALHNLSVALENLGRLPEALDALGEQGRLWPRFDPQRAFRFAGLALQADAPERAIPVLERYLSESERLSQAERVQAKNLLAAACMMQGKLEVAESLLHAVLQVDPQNRAASRNIEWIQRQGAP